MPDNGFYSIPNRNSNKNNEPKTKTYLEMSCTDSTPVAQGNEDTCGLYGMHKVEQSLSLDLQKLVFPKLSGRPCYLDKASIENRLKTYRHWPKSMKQRPQQLGEAGFFYSQIGDKTFCFYCGLGLENWEDTDDPWEEHALWSPDCEFLNLCKGSEFVAEVHEKKSPEDYLNELRSENKEEQVNVTPKEPQSENSSQLCKICLTNDLGVVFLPCGHIVACVECGAILKTCAVCRKPIEAVARAYLS